MKNKWTRMDERDLQYCRKKMTEHIKAAGVWAKAVLDWERIKRKAKEKQ